MKTGLSGRYRSKSGRPLVGESVSPGDKSISHRAILLGAMAEGVTEVTGLLEGHDVLRTAAAMRALGATVERDMTAAGPLWRVSGGRWRAPARPLYFGNSGTGCRLVMGAAAGRGIETKFDGDASLRSRPMGRIVLPLQAMGASIDSRDGKLPLDLRRSSLSGVTYELPVASAQIKSAILLAGLGARGTTTVVEPTPSRDHTERMLPAFGCAIEIGHARDGRILRLTGGQQLTAAAIAVPGDPSSAAFLAAAAAITPGSDVLVRNVLMNPLRGGFFETLIEMGALMEFQNRRELNGEAVADIRVRASKLKGVDVPVARAPSMIDEYPILAVVAAFARGRTKMAGVEELRVKESDRLAAIENGLNANGVVTQSGPDWLCVEGRDGDAPGGGRVETNADHRIAMSFLVMGLASAKPVEIDDASMIATSFPEFVTILNGCGADISSISP